jgi:hypothetical protein
VQQPQLEGRARRAHSTARTWRASEGLLGASASAAEGAEAKDAGAKAAGAKAAASDSAADFCRSASCSRSCAISTYAHAAFSGAGFPASAADWPGLMPATPMGGSGMTDRVPWLVVHD